MVSKTHFIGPISKLQFKPFKANIWNTALQYVITMIMNTHSDHLEEIIETARDRLARNSYPLEYAESVITEAKEKVALKALDTLDNKTRDEPRIFYTQGLPYIPQLTEKIQKKIQNSAAKKYAEKGENVKPQIPAIHTYKMGKLQSNS